VRHGARRGLATVINDQATDALAVQEIGDPAALDDLIGLLDGAWQQQVSTHPDGRGHPGCLADPPDDHRPGRDL
jgi:hypothetical protein